MNRRRFLTTLASLPFAGALAHKMGWAAPQSFARGGLVHSGSCLAGLQPFQTEIPRTIEDQILLHRGNIPQPTDEITCCPYNVLDAPYTITAWLRDQEHNHKWHHVHWHLPRTFAGGPVKGNVAGYSIGNIGDPLDWKPYDVVSLFDGPNPEDVVYTVIARTVYEYTSGFHPRRIRADLSYSGHVHEGEPHLRIEPEPEWRCDSLQIHHFVLNHNFLIEGDEMMRYLNRHGRALRKAMLHQAGR